MKNIIPFFATWLLCISAFAQKNTPGCYCPTKGIRNIPSLYKPNTKATKVFDLGNGKSIALCGYEDKELIKGRTFLREFVLSVCGSDKPIDFWGAIEICNVKLNKDTLFVETLKWMPVNPTAKETPFVWTTERFYYTSNKLNRTLTINPKLPKYSPAQIAVVLNLYKHYDVNDNSETLDELADKLLLCALSGSAEAENCLKNFPKRFKNLDGATAEGYDDTYRMFQLWQKQGFKTIEVK